MFMRVFWIDVEVRRIGELFKAMLNKVLVGAKEQVAVNHMNPEAIDATKEMVNDPSRDMEVDIYMTWSRRGDA